MAMECLYSLVVFIIFITTVLSHHLDRDISDEYQDFLTTNHDDYSVPEQYTLQELNISHNPLAKYEVTEIIEDIPNTNTLGPIITNYTMTKPINLATTPGNVINTDQSNSTHVENETKKNYLSIFHIKLEYDKENESLLNFSKIPQVFGIKEYINGLKNGIVSGFNSVINKFRMKNESEEFPNVVTGPVLFIDKLKKSSGVSSREHKGVFEHNHY